MTKKEKVWSIICAISVIVGLLGYFGIQPPYTKSNIDPETLAIELVKHLPDQKNFAAKDEEIKELKATIERLQNDSSDELKQQALKALAEDDTEKAVELMEESAQSRIVKAAQDYIDIGNIAYLTDSQKALNAYEKAVNLDSSNMVAWNRLGYIKMRLGYLEEAKHAFEKVFELAGGDKECEATAYGGLGYIYKDLGDLDKAEEYYLKSLDINKSLGSLGGMADAYGNLGYICKTRGDLDKACDYWRQSFNTFTNIGAQDKIELVRGWITENCK